MKFARFPVFMAVTLISACLVPPLEAQQLPPRRELAPGVETTIPRSRAEAETQASHNIVELIDGIPDLEWTPKEFEKSKTLFEKVQQVIFRRGTWYLQFTFKPVRLIRVDVPQPNGKMQQTLVWYMVYRVVNPGAHLTPVQAKSEQFSEGKWKVVDVNTSGQMLASIGPHRFIPTFLLRTHKTSALTVDDSTIQYTDVIIPAARRAIYDRERPNCKFEEFYDTVQMGREPVPVSAGREQKSRWGVVMWTGIDRNTDFFTVQVMGLTNAYQWVDPEGAFKPGDPPATGRTYTYKTLQLNFYRPGDEFEAREEEIQLGVEGHPKFQWLFRPNPVTHKPTRPRT